MPRKLPLDIEQWILAERRSGQDRRRGGRPRLLTEGGISWAIAQLAEGRRCFTIALDLGVSERTLERRVAARRTQERRAQQGRLSRYDFRCPACAAVIADPICPYCQTLINPGIAELRGLT